MIAHSAAWCQWSSRMPPAVRRMLTPEISFEIAKSFTVTSRAQPPFWMRLAALLKEAHVIGIPPTSVAGGDCAAGNWPPITGFCGPGSVRFSGPFALIAPCAGSSGLPKDAALAADTVAATPSPDTARRFRLEIMSLSCDCCYSVVVRHSALLKAREPSDDCLPERRRSFSECTVLAGRGS